MTANREHDSLRRPLRTGAGIFALAGMCALAAGVLPLDSPTGKLIGLIASMLTLAGLLLIAFGPEDERPLKAAPLSRWLLVVAALACVAQSLLRNGVIPGVTSGSRFAVVSLVMGLVGGTAAVAAAVRVRESSRGRGGLLWFAALVGLGIAGLGEFALSAAPLLQLTDPLLAANRFFSGSGDALIGCGELIIGLAFWRLPALPDMTRQPTHRNRQREQVRR